MRFTLALLTAGMILLCECGVAVAEQTPTSSPDRRAAMRPILHFDVEGTGAQARGVTRGVYPDGRQTPAFVRTPTGVVWAPDASSFAYMWRNSSGRSVLSLGDPQRLLGTPVFTSDPAETIHPWKAAFSPDSRRIAVMTHVTDHSYEVVVIDIATATVRSRHALPKGTLSLLYTSPPNIFRWSPDGRRILVSWDQAVVVDTERGGTQPIAPGPVIAEWAPGSDAIYYFSLTRSGSRPLGFYVRRLAEPEPVRLTDADGLTRAGFRPARWLINGVMVLSPSATQLAIATGSTRSDPDGKWQYQAVRVYKLDAARPVVLERPSHTFYSEDLMTAVEWSPDEKSLAVLAVVVRAKEEKPVHVRVVDLASGTWRTVAHVEFQLRTPDLLGFKILSWTQ